MEFVLNHRLIKLQHFHGDTTLLRYLREDLKLCGTKEGCASGDCGACTLLVGNLNEGLIEYQSMNACIIPLGAMHGKHVVTIEHLQQTDELHPVQKAFVGSHASQCGFCTPGFVMSITAFYAEHEKHPYEVKRDNICKALSGNLCRCTGYRPIIDAGINASQASEVKLYDAKTLKVLANIKEKNLSSFGENTYFRPQKLEDWQNLRLRHPDAPMVAGGTDLVLEISTKYADMPELIDISNIEELLSYEVNPNQVTIGANLSYTELETKLKDIFPHFVSLRQQLGSPQIRNRGTLGGNIANASPVADTPAVFLALDATLNVYSSLGKFRTIPLSEFYLSYKKTQLKKNEIIVSLSFPIAALSNFHRFYKITKRHDDDIASVMAAFRISLTPNDSIRDARIAYSGMAATPIRVSAAEQVLIGKSIHDPNTLNKLIKAIENSLHPISDVRASDHYRRSMAVNLCRKAWLGLKGNSLNPTLDIGQIEGGFVQGMGWLTTEELLWNDKGRLTSNSPANYKIPTASDVPENFNVKLYKQPNNEDTLYYSKAVREPPLMLASVWCALRDACAASRTINFARHSLCRLPRNRCFMPLAKRSAIMSAQRLTMLPTLSRGKINGKTNSMV